MLNPTATSASTSQWVLQRSPDNAQTLKSLLYSMTNPHPTTSPNKSPKRQQQHESVDYITSRQPLINGKPYSSKGINKLAKPTMVTQSLGSGGKMSKKTFNIDSVIAIKLPERKVGEREGFLEPLSYQPQHQHGKDDGEDEGDPLFYIKQHYQRVEDNKTRKQLHTSNLKVYKTIVKLSPIKCKPVVNDELTELYSQQQNRISSTLKAQNRILQTSKTNRTLNKQFINKNLPFAYIFDTAIRVYTRVKTRGAWGFWLDFVIVSREEERILKFRCGMVDRISRMVRISFAVRKVNELRIKRDDDRRKYAIKIQAQIRRCLVLIKLQKVKSEIQQILMHASSLKIIQAYKSHLIYQHYTLSKLHKALFKSLKALCPAKTSLFKAHLLSGLQPAQSVLIARCVGIATSDNVKRKVGVDEMQGLIEKVDFCKIKRDKLVSDNKIKYINEIELKERIAKEGRRVDMEKRLKECVLNNAKKELRRVDDINARNEIEDVITHERKVRHGIEVERKETKSKHRIECAHMAKAEENQRLVVSGLSALRLEGERRERALFENEERLTCEFLEKLFEYEEKKEHVDFQDERIRLYRGKLLISEDDKAPIDEEGEGEVSKAAPIDGKLSQSPSFAVNVYHPNQLSSSSSSASPNYRTLTLTVKPTPSPRAIEAYTLINTLSNLNVNYSNSIHQISLTRTLLINLKKDMNEKEVLKLKDKSRTSIGRENCRNELVKAQQRVDECNVQLEVYEHDLILNSQRMISTILDIARMLHASSVIPPFEFDAEMPAIEDVHDYQTMARAREWLVHVREWCFLAEVKIKFYLKPEYLYVVGHMAGLRMLEEATLKDVVFCVCCFADFRVNGEVIHGSMINGDENEGEEHEFLSQGVYELMTNSASTPDEFYDSSSTSDLSVSEEERGRISCFMTNLVKFGGTFFFSEDGTFSILNNIAALDKYNIQTEFLRNSITLSLMNGTADDADELELARMKDMNLKALYASVEYRDYMKFGGLSFLLSLAVDEHDMEKEGGDLLSAFFPRGNTWHESTVLLGVEGDEYGYDSDDSHYFVRGNEVVVEEKVEEKVEEMIPVPVRIEKIRSIKPKNRKNTEAKLRVLRNPITKDEYNQVEFQLELHRKRFYEKFEEFKKMSRAGKERFVKEGGEAVFGGFGFNLF